MITILRLTLREVLNKKILLIAAILNIVFLLLFGTLLRFTVRGMESVPVASLQKAMLYPQLFSMGLYFASFLVNLFAIFISVGTISSEIESGIMQTILPKPVHRAELIIGKFVGYGLTIGVLGASIFVALLAMLKFMCGYVPTNTGFGMMLFLLQPLILLTLSIVGSTFFSTIANGITVIMLYVIATVGGMVETIGGFLKNSTLINTGIISSLLVPTDAMYRKMVSVMIAGNGSPLNVLSMTPFGTNAPPSTFMIVYTCLYLMLFLYLGIHIFAKRDI